MVFIAELFWWFENVRPDFVQPRDVQELKDGEWDAAAGGCFPRASSSEAPDCSLRSWAATVPGVNGCIWGRARPV